MAEIIHAQSNRQLFCIHKVLISYLHLTLSSGKTKIQKQMLDILRISSLKLGWFQTETSQAIPILVLINKGGLHSFTPQLQAPLSTYLHITFGYFSSFQTTPNPSVTNFSFKCSFTFIEETFAPLFDSERPILRLARGLVRDSMIRRAFSSSILYVYVINRRYSGEGLNIC